MGLFFSFRDPGKSLIDPGKYTGDFEIIETPQDHGGRTHRQVKYTGPWFILRDQGQAVLGRLWACLPLSILLGAAEIRLLLLTHAGSGSLYVMLPLLAALFPLLYLCMGAFSLPLRGKPQRRDQYMHGYIRVSRSCVAILACITAGLLGTLLYRLLHADWLFFPEDLWFLGLGLAVLVLAGAILLLLRGVEIIERENTAFPNMIVKK